MADDLAERLRIKADMINLGEKIAWGSETALMDEAADRITALQAQNRKLVEALRLYSCEDGCNDCPEHERDRVGCGWTARAAIAEAEKGADHG